MEQIKIGLLGFGNVGTGVFKILEQNRDKITSSENFDIRVEKILVKDLLKKRTTSANPEFFTDNIEDIINNPEISIVAEFMGGVEPAKSYILSALNSKKTVVTANKELIAKHGPELFKAAKDNGVGLYLEASVAGGIPIIKVMGQSLQANNIKEIMGIINGTTNFILTKMTEEGKDFGEILKEAQILGYAEPDPTADIEGFDTMYKLSILSSIAFNKLVHIDNIHREGITSITVDDINYGKELGFTMRLLAIAKNNGSSIETRVHPTFIPNEHPLASVRDSFNAIFIKGDAVGDLMLYGRGAGDLPTGSAIVSDIITACERKGVHPNINYYEQNSNTDDLTFNKNWDSEFFVRLTVKDKPGVLAKIASVFSKYDVSITSVIQKGRNKDEVPLIFVTHKAFELSMRDAINEINDMLDVIKVENVIRVER